MSKSRSAFKRSIMFNLFARFIAVAAIYTIALFAVFLVVVFIGESVIWQEGPIYRILKSINNNRIIIFFIVWMIGNVIVFFRYWGRPVEYIEEISEASINLVKLDDEIISLSPELKNVENQLNYIKSELRKNERAAKEAEQRKNDLVVYLAHDLKTPLTSVIGYLTLLRDEQHISQELREKYLSISLEKSERLEELINEFFEITRFNLINLSLDLGSVNLSRMLEQIISEFNPLFETKNISCRLDIEKDIILKCDIKKMERVIDNLIRNSINYSFENSEIVITVLQALGGISIKFTNSGNTIPSEKLDRIFEQFYRLDTARASKTGGAGLGLAIVKEIIELHKGKIKAFSQNEIIEIEIFLPQSYTS